MTIHHYEGNKHWTKDVNMDLLDEGDVVITQDPQQRLGLPTFVVEEMDHEDARERVVHRGLFWKVEEARRYANALHNGRVLYDGE